MAQLSYTTMPCYIQGEYWYNVSDVECILSERFRTKGLRAEHIMNIGSYMYINTKGLSTLIMNRLLKKNKVIQKLLKDLNRNRDSFMTVHVENKHLKKMLHTIKTLPKNTSSGTQTESSSNYLCVVQKSKTLSAITGKRISVESRLSKLRGCTVLLKTPRPEPRVDWYNVLDAAKTFSTVRIKNTIRFNDPEEISKFVEVLQSRVLL